VISELTEIHDITEILLKVALNTIDHYIILISLAEISKSKIGKPNK
jgi:hypothetical protein